MGENDEYFYRYMNIHLLFYFFFMFQESQNLKSLKRERENILAWEPRVIMELGSERKNISVG